MFRPKPSKSVIVDVRIPAYVCDRIDEFARRGGITRGALLREIVADCLRHPPRVLPLPAPERSGLRGVRMYLPADLAEQMVVAVRRARTSQARWVAGAALSYLARAAKGGEGTTPS